MDTFAEREGPLRAPFRWFTVGLLIIAWYSLLIGSRALSLAMDEPFHIVAGYSFLARGPRSLWHIFEHHQVPILGALEAGLIYLDKPNIPLEMLSGWSQNFIEYTASFMPYLQPLERTEALSRAPVMLLTLLLLAIVFRWTLHLTRSPTAGFLAVFILTFDPSLRAHGRFATMDAGATLMALLTSYITWKWARSPSWKWASILGIILGLSMVVKFSAILYVISVALTAFWKTFRERVRWKRYGAYMCLSLVLAFIVVWISFGMDIGYMDNVPLPVPAPHFWQTLLDIERSVGERAFIAFGDLQVGSHWWYFPLNFLIKNPLPWIAAVFWGAVMLLRSRPRWNSLIPVASLPVVYTASAILRGMNVSYRHMLPAHPFLAMLAAYGIWRTLKRKPVGRSLAVWIPLGLWYIGGTLAIFPDELAYFNELVGGPAGAPRYLVDYTQDWGQSMKQLRAYLDAHPGPEPYVVYYTHVRPEYYGIRYRSLAPSPGATYQVTPLYPQVGRYAIGVSTLYGLVGRDRMELEWFRRAIPQAVVGHAYYIYEVQEHPQWLFQCSLPSPPLDDSAVTWGFGPGVLRRGTFDCTKGWIYPAGDGTLGTYALHGHLLEQPRAFLPPSLRPHPTPTDEFVRRHLAGTRLAYYQPFFGLLPAFALYEGGIGSPVRNYQLMTNVNTSGGESLQAPVSLAGPLTFLGAVAFRDQSGIDVETWWQVTEGPITRPLSIMGHLLNGAGEMIGQNDGLGVLPVIWLPGDIIVQRHQFPLPPADEKLWLRTGVYWLDTMERWPIADFPQTDVLLIPLEKGEW